ncbi:bifunctional diguanylate cyclase/phosphodiesterase [Sulfurospirillum arcachonense]|uniref:bifunctional diguanylate cyclase/phosphodiesterase n=1 Tax=Sulfurospirillum arcachonense TaxID=57666 RepID=UPI00046ADB56|nr:LapD/MoxY N-terminal periplasmic domain-containing protein [Sulfurospirillum arcachonense]
MTLFKQIAIIFSLFIILIMGSVMYLNFNSANNFIQNQLYTTAEDTATSLGLSLSMNIPQNSEDLSTMETMINAIFDRGYYESIILKDMDGKVLIQNKNILKVKNIPNWFINNINIVVPTAKTQISAGWIPYGTLSVKLHSGHAYMQLWNIFTEILETFSILICIVFLCLYFLLKFVLKSLKGVENQAMAITNNDFIIQEKLPFTTEFKNVIKGMNKMVVKVKDIFEHEALMVQKYNDLLYNDQDTGMGNRKFFSLRLSSLLNQNDAKSSGTIVIFVLNNFIEAKKSVGYKVLNDYINKLAEIFYNTTSSVEERVVTRLKDSEFSMILPETNYENTKKIINHFLQSAEDITPNELRKIPDFFISGGATYYNEEDNQKEILSRADFALSSAKMKNETYVHFHEIKNDESLMELGQEEWYKLITNAIKNNGIKLALQAVKDIDGKIFHQEAYLRMSDDKGNIYPARIFMPMLNNLDLTDDVDKEVITIAIKLAQRNTSIAINIAPSFIKNNENLYWLENIFKQSTEQNLQVSFESSNYSVINNLENYINFSKLVQNYNYSFGIDNFNITKQNLEYLQDIKPAYIKADKSFFIDMHDDGKSNIYESFKLLTQSLDIKLIGTAVEEELQCNNLKEIPIHLMQGAYIQKPTL